MRNLRTIHLYIGCLFAPALIFFIVTGCWQIFRLNDAKKDGSYSPPAVVRVLSEVHVHQRYIVGAKHSSTFFRTFVLTMAGFLLVTIAIGILLALRASRRPWTVWVCLLGGILLPVFFLWLDRWRG